MKTALLYRKVRQAFLPTPQMRELERWNAAGGDEYWRFNYDNIGQESLIVDIGGYHGQWTSDMIARFGCKSIVIEPIPEYAAFIRRRFLYNQRAIVREFALGAETRHVPMDSDGVYSTEFCKNPDIGVDMLDAGEYFRDRLPAHIAAVSMNCEGGEYEILPRLIETDQIRKIEELEIQFHDFVSDAVGQRREIRRKLAITHREVYSYPFIWEHWRRK